MDLLRLWYVPTTNGLDILIGMFCRFVYSAKYLNLTGIKIGENIECPSKRNKLGGRLCIVLTGLISRRVTFLVADLAPGVV